MTADAVRVPEEAGAEERQVLSYGIRWLTPVLPGRLLPVGAWNLSELLAVDELAATAK